MAKKRSSHYLGEQAFLVRPDGSIQESFVESLHEDGPGCIRGNFEPGVKLLEYFSLDEALQAAREIVQKEVDVAETALTAAKQKLQKIGTDVLVKRKKNKEVVPEFKPGQTVYMTTTRMSPHLLASLSRLPKQLFFVFETKVRWVTLGKNGSLWYQLHGFELYVRKEELSVTLFDAKKKLVAQFKKDTGGTLSLDQIEVLKND